METLIRVAVTVAIIIGLVMFVLVVRFLACVPSELRRIARALEDRNDTAGWDKLGE